MAQFDVYERSDGEEGLLLNIQSDFLDNLPTRVVLPLLPEAIRLPPLLRLNPRFTIEGSEWTLFPQYAAAYPKGELRLFVVSLEHERERIRDALDFLIIGF